MNNRHQFVLFILITLIGAGVVAAAIATPPSRFDPVGTKNIMAAIGVLVTLFAAICTLLAFAQARHGGSDETSKSLGSLKSGAIFIFVPTLMSVLIVERLVTTELVLAAIFFLVGLLVIRNSPEYDFDKKNLLYLGLSAVALTFGVSQLFNHVLGLPLP